MKKVKIILGVLLLIFFSAVVINLADHAKDDPVKVAMKHLPPREANPYMESLLSEYETTIRKLQRQTRAPGVAIVVVQDTTVIYMKGFGVREVGKPDTIEDNTVFRLASVSKTFAPVLTGLLIEEGILSWDDPIVKWVPDFKMKSKEYTESLTIKHVLSHTTGLPYHTYTTLVEDGLDLKTMINALEDVQPTNKPGEIYSYQNVAFSLIAEVIQAATGKPYEQEMIDRVFKPLRMNESSLTFEEIITNANVAKPHMIRRKGWSPTAIKNTYYNVSPAGGINASISDMSEYIKAMLGGKTTFIRKKTLDEIFAPTVKAKSKNRNFRKWIEPADSYYALGWRVLNFKTDTLLYHGGYVNGYRSEIALNRKNKIGICVLSNAPGSLVDNSIPYFFHLYFQRRKEILDWEFKQAVVARQALEKTNP
jgi:beta-lactamase class C